MVIYFLGFFMLHGLSSGIEMVVPSGFIVLGLIWEWNLNDKSQESDT